MTETEDTENPNLPETTPPNSDVCGGDYASVRFFLSWKLNPLSFVSYVKISWDVEPREMGTNDPGRFSEVLTNTEIDELLELGPESFPLVDSRSLRLVPDYQDVTISKMDLLDALEYSGYFRNRVVADRTQKKLDGFSGAKDTSMFRGVFEELGSRGTPLLEEDGLPFEPVG